MARYTLNLSEICQQMTGLDFNKMTGSAFDRVDDIVNTAIPILISDRYDIFDNGDDRNDLLRRVFEHYWEYEVCTYTPSDFILRLNRKLNEIMPYYNQRYESTKLTFPIFEDTDYTDTGSDDATNLTLENNKGNTTNYGTDITDNQERGTTKTENDHSDTTTYGKTVTNEIDTDTAEGLVQAKRTDWDYHNDTPQGSISGITDSDYLSSYGKNTSELADKTVKIVPGQKTDVNGESYTHSTVEFTAAQGGNIGSEQSRNSGKTGGSDEVEGDFTTTVSHGKGNKTTLDHGHKIDTTGEHTSNFSHDASYDKHIKGKANSGKSYAEMLMEYRAAMINIYQEVIDELHELFFLIY